MPCRPENPSTKEDALGHRMPSRMQNEAIARPAERSHGATNQRKLQLPTGRANLGASFKMGRALRHAQAQGWRRSGQRQGGGAKKKCVAFCIIPGAPFNIGGDLML